MDRWFHSFLTTTLQRKCCHHLTHKKTKIWEGKAVEPTSPVSPLDDRFVIQLPGRGLHDGKLLPCHLAQCRVLHGGGDGADELREDPVRGQDGEGAHGIHGRLPDRHSQCVSRLALERGPARLYAPGNQFPFSLLLLTLSEYCPLEWTAVACACFLSKYLLLILWF